MILVFSKRAATEKAAKLHSDSCTVPEGAKAHPSRFAVISENVQANVADLEARGYPINNCPCLRDPKGETKMVKQMSLTEIDEQIKALEDMRAERAATVLVDFKTAVEKLAADMGLTKDQLTDALRPLVGKGKRGGGKRGPSTCAFCDKEAIGGRFGRRCETHKDKTKTELKAALAKKAA